MSKIEEGTNHELVSLSELTKISKEIKAAAVAEENQLITIIIAEFNYLLKASLVLSGGVINNCEFDIQYAAGLSERGLRILQGRFAAGGLNVAVTADHGRFGKTHFKFTALALKGSDLWKPSPYPDSVPPYSQV